MLSAGRTDNQVGGISGWFREIVDGGLGARGDREQDSDEEDGGETHDGWDC